MRTGVCVRVQRFYIWLWAVRGVVRINVLQSGRGVGGAGGAYADRSMRVQRVWLWVCGWCMCCEKCERAKRADRMVRKKATRTMGRTVVREIVLT
jgi:hypothetical protein